MKEWQCITCDEEKLVEVNDDYEEEYCCSGATNQCGCAGMPTNPVFCVECHDQLFDK